MRLSLPVDIGVATIRHLSPKDHDAYIALERDAEVKKFVGGPNQKSEAEMRKDLERSTPSERFMAIADPQTDAYIGRCGLISHAPGEVEMHCVIAKPYWNKRIGRTVFRELVKLARQAGVRPVAIVDPHNQSSCQALEATGFILAGAVSREDHYQNGHLRYVIKEEEKGPNQSSQPTPVNRRG